MKQLLNNHLIKYLIVGGSNTVISLLLYYLLLKIGINYLVANALCFVVGVLLGYTLNTLIVFKGSLYFKSLIKYSTIYLFSLVFSSGALFILVHYFELNKMLAQILVTMIVTVLNYVLIKTIVFNREKIHT
jgi:putative flippase GtrA